MDLKESYPVQTAEFAISHGLDQKSAFCWWIPNTLKHCNRIISAIKTRYAKKTHKYGIQVLRNVEEAYLIEKETDKDSSISILR